MSIESMRREIDAIDRELIALLNRRFDLSVAIGEEKKKQKTAVRDPGREEEILRRIEAASSDHAEAIASVYRALFQSSRDLQR